MIHTMDTPLNPRGSHPSQLVKSLVSAGLSRPGLSETAEKSGDEPMLSDITTAKHYTYSFIFRG
jgi:hypothetical protein